MRKEFRLSAINGVAKKAALGAMLFSSVVMFATTPNRNTRTENPPQAEVVSREGADALKANTFPGQQQNSAVPTVHNQKLDNNLKIFYTNEDPKTIEDFLSSVYKANGSYLGSALIQQYIDLNMFMAFLDGNIEILKKFDENYDNSYSPQHKQKFYDAANALYTNGNMAKIADLRSKVKDWIQDNYFNIYAEALTFDNPPDFFELDKKIVNFSKNNDLQFSPSSAKMFTETLDFEAQRLGELRNASRASLTQSAMDYIVNEIHFMNKDLFENLCQLFYVTNTNLEMYNLLDIFMQASAPGFDMGFNRK